MTSSYKREQLIRFLEKEDIDHGLSEDQKTQYIASSQHEDILTEHLSSIEAYFRLKDLELDLEIASYRGALSNQLSEFLAISSLWDYLRHRRA